MATHSAATRRRVCVIGSGGIGQAVVDALVARGNASVVHLYRAGPAAPQDDGGLLRLALDTTDEASVAAAASAVAGPLDLVFVATGTLHEGTRQPEKTLRQINAAHMLDVLAVNTVGPALVARHFIPLLRRDSPATFAALSARVGSIGDNRLGGWYSYRASKAALNMLLRTLAIEVRRTHPQALVVGLHPGTVDTALSAPFQANVPAGKLFSPAHSAARLLAVLDQLDHTASGQVYDWAGERVPE